MKQKVLGLLLLIGVISILGACGNKEVKPVAINEETDTCATCNMQVVDNQFATQIILENGKSLYLMILAVCINGLLRMRIKKSMLNLFVITMIKNGCCIDDATYVYNQSIKTPMAYNVISFTDKADAENFAADNEGSTLLTASELDQHSWDTNQDMMMKNGTDDHSHSEDNMHK